MMEIVDVAAIYGEGYTEPEECASINSDDVAEILASQESGSE